MQKVDDCSEESVPEEELGQSKKYFIFNMEGCSGIDVKLPSTSDPEMLVWVNACTDEDQNCGQIAAINAVIQKENQITGTAESTEKPAAEGVTF